VCVKSAEKTITYSGKFGYAQSEKGTILVIDYSYAKD